MLKYSVAVVAAFVLVFIAACGGNESEAQVPSDPTAVPSSARNTPSEEPTAELGTAVQPTAPRRTISAAASTPTETTQTTRSATAMAMATASPTPTPNPIPHNGAELRIDDRTVRRIIPGDESGRTLYAITEDAVMRSNDGGESWSEATGHATLHDPKSEIIVALNEPNVLYAGDRSGCGRGLSFDVFARSTDAARSWNVVDANQDFEPLLAYESRQAAYLFATSCGLSVSDDGGDSWKRIPDLAGEEIFAVATDTSDPLKHILVVGATEGGTGRLFLLDTARDPTQPDLLGAVAQFWGNAALDWYDGRIVLATASQVGVSDDRGESWSWTRDGIEAATFSVDPLVEGIPDNELDPSRGFSIVRIDRTDPDRIWIGGVHGAFQSHDAGRTWERLGDDVPVTSLVVSEAADRIFVSTETSTRIWTLDGN